MTALTMAVRGGHKGVAELLTQHSADISVTDK